MTLKSGKESIHAAQRRIEELEKALAYERSTKPMLREFARRLGESLLTKLANMPYEQWPQFAKDTFAWWATDAPNAAYTYKDMLPK